VQKLQMTTVLADNVYNLEVKGNFDDCQRVIKEIFSELAFKKKFQLGAINSINWARILGQITHYFYAGLKQLKEKPQDELHFCVPTGNFGHIYAGLVAKKMGLPIKKLILATNENDILTRLINEGSYQVQEAVATLAPAMDIQRASNFERYLYFLCDQDTQQVASMMKKFQEHNCLNLSRGQRKKMATDFISASANQEQVSKTIQKYYSEQHYLLDTHTAVGVFVAEQLSPSRTICLSTAHPAKFYDSIEKIIQKEIPKPPSIQQLFSKKQKMEKIAASKEQVMQFVQEKLSRAVKKKF
jgi:threonine synthase